MSESGQSRYEPYWADKEKEWGGRCARCGACCGAFDDPCENLLQTAPGSYSCAIYERRFGPRQTVSGKKFMCVPIRDKLAAGQSWPGDERCGYTGRSNG